jgi:hypothetical protein
MKTQPKLEENDIDTLAYEPDYSLVQSLGGESEFSQIFSKKNISKCQALINAARDDFFNSCRPVVDEILQLEKQHPATNAQLTAIGRHACSLGQQAEALQFPLIYKLCDYLLEICLAGDRISAKHRSLLKDLVSMLDLACRERIRDDGGPISREILKVLDKLDLHSN